MSIADRVRERREALGMNQKELSTAVKARGGSISQAQISGIESGTVRRPRSLPELAAALQTSVDWLLDTGEKHLAKDPPPIKPQAIVTVPLQRGLNNLPVYGCTEGSGGVWMIDPTPVQMVERPEFLRYSAAAFGIYCNGSQQAPVFEPRDMVIVDPNKPTAIGDDVVLVKHFSIGEAVPFQGILRRLIGQTETHWHVRQFNPPRDYKVTKEEWPRALFVAGKYSR